MRFDLHLRSTVLEDLQALAGEMRTWQSQAKVGEAEAEQIRQHWFRWVGEQKSSIARVTDFKGRSLYSSEQTQK